MREPAARPKLRSRERIRRFRQFLRVAATIGSNGRVASLLYARIGPPRSLGCVDREHRIRVTYRRHSVRRQAMTIS
jgi:hypothetical protein